MKTPCLLGLTAGLLMLAQAFAEDRKNPGTAGDELIGSYTITGGERGGKRLAEQEVKDVTVRIAANAITTYDRDKKEVYVATYKLDTSRKPWRITLTATLSKEGQGTVAPGLIEREGDTVRLIYALPQGEPPTDFKSREKQQLFTLQRSGK